MLRRRRATGFILAVALLLCSISLFLIAYCGLQTAEFTLMNEVLDAEQAFDAASALQESGVAHVMYQPDWSEGFSRHEFRNGRATAQLTFNRSFFVPWSLNNASAWEQATGWEGRPVPPGYVHMVVPALSPDDTPDNGLDNGLGVHVTRQALVHPYRQYWLEDFHSGGKDAPRHAWTFSDDREPRKAHVIKDRYCVMGGFGRGDGFFAEAGASWWEDYDLEAVVAYYGHRGFGLMVRNQDFKGYCALISPLQGHDAVVGASVQFFTTGARGRNWVPFSASPPDTHLVIDGVDERSANPFLTQGPEYVRETSWGVTTIKPRHTIPPGLWRIRMSVENRNLLGEESRIVGLTVASLAYDSKEKRLYETGVSRSFFTRQPAGERIDRGRIGFFCEPNTVVGIANVYVYKRNHAMITIPSRWLDR